MRVAISKKNEVYLRISAPPHINYELSDYFTFDVPNAKYLRSQRKYKWWDGKIKLYSPGTGELYVGLYPYLICLLYTSPSPRDLSTSRMPSSA